VGVYGKRKEKKTKMGKKLVKKTHAPWVFKIGEKAKIGLLRNQYRSSVQTDGGTEGRPNRDGD